MESFRRIPRVNFLADLRNDGIEVDPRYVGSQSLIFVPPNDLWRVWEHSDSGPEALSLITALIDTMGREQEWSVYKQGGSWFSYAANQRVDEYLISRLSDTGLLPRDCNDVLQFQANQINELISLIFGFATFGFTQWDEIFVVGERRSEILHISEGELATVSFRTEARMNEFVAQMEGRGFPLEYTKE